MSGHKFVSLARRDGKRVLYCQKHQVRISLNARGDLGLECDRLHKLNAKRPMEVPT